MKFICWKQNCLYIDVEMLRFWDCEILRCANMFSRWKYCKHGTCKNFGVRTLVSFVRCNWDLLLVRWNFTDSCVSTSNFWKPADTFLSFGKKDFRKNYPTKVCRNHAHTLETRESTIFACFTSYWTVIALIRGHAYRMYTHTLHVVCPTITSDKSALTTVA